MAQYVFGINFGVIKEKITKTHYGSAIITIVVTCFAEHDSTCA